MKFTNEESYKNIIKSIVKKCINEKTGIFDELYSKFLENYLYRVEEVIKKYLESQNSIAVNKEQILSSIARSFKEVLINVCQKTLIVELYENKTSLEGISSEDRYDYFVNKYMIDHFSEVLENDKEIQKIISNRIYNSTNAISEFFLRLRNDYIEICNLIEEDVYEISDLSIGSGDTHNNGRNVYVVTLNKNKKVLYKPHSLMNDIIYSKVIEFANDTLELKVKLEHVKVIEKEFYGWQKFIKSKSCKNEEEVENYMYRFGSLVFISYLLNCTDLHFENVIAHGSMPYIVDTETLFTNLYSFKGIKYERIDGLNRVFNDSIFASFLLPINIENVKSPVYKNLDMSGFLGGMDNDSEVEINIIVNRGTDNIGFDQRKILVNKGFELKNKVKLKDEQIKFGDYIEELINGFKDCYKLFSNHKKEFLNYIQKIDFGKGEYRQVFRNTKLYYKYLDATLHPYYLKSLETRKKVFSCLKGSEILCNEHIELINSEIQQLLNDDIPYFYAKFNSKDLYCYDGIVAKDFFSKTLLEIFEEKIDKLSKKDLIRQEYFIRCSLANIYNEKENKIYISFPDYPSELEDVDKKIADYVKDIHMAPLNNNEIFEVFNVVNRNEKFALGQLQPMLYESIGVAFFYLSMFHEYKDKTYKEVFEKLTYQYNKVDISSLHKLLDSLGVFDGCTSLMYLNYNAAVVLGEKKYWDYFNNNADYLINIDLSEYKNTDIVSGCAGIIIAALNIYKNDSRQRKMLDIADKFSKRLIELYKNGTVLENTGFAHGLSGTGCALILASNYLNNKDYYEYGMKLINRENCYCLKEKNNWLDLRKNEESMVAWCYGVIGILLARINILKYVKEKDKEIIERDIEHCLNKIKYSDFINNQEDILCHGVGGIFDVLISYCNIFGIDHKELLGKFGIDEWIERLNKSINIKNPIKVINVSFMTGIIGVGYFLMRMKDHKLPSILFLQSFRL